MSHRCLAKGKKVTRVLRSFILLYALSLSLARARAEQPKATEPQIFAGEEFQGRARLRRRQASLGLFSLSKGRSVHRRDPLCKSAANDAHLNHVGGALKVIRTPRRPRAGILSTRRVSECDSRRDAPTCRHCFNDDALRSTRDFYGRRHIIAHFTRDRVEPG